MNSDLNVTRPELDVVIFDMGQLSFVRRAGSVTVSSPFVGDIATVTLEAGESARESVFSVLDEALRSAALPGAGSTAKVAFLNPCSGQVAVGPIPVTAVFQVPEGFTVPPFGLLARAVWGEGRTPDGWRDSQSGPSELTSAAWTLPRLCPDMLSTMQAFSSH